MEMKSAKKRYYRDLEPEEILVLFYAPSFCTGQTEFQRFWEYKYGVQDVPKILEMLKQKGLIKEGTLYDGACLCRVPELKSILKKYGLKATGKKEQLISTLFDSVPAAQLTDEFTSIPFHLTAEGEETLNRHPWIPFIHRHPIQGLDIRNLTEMVETPPYLKYGDKIWGYLNRKAQDYISSKDYGLYRCTLLEMHDFLVAEKNDRIDLLHFLAEIIAIDINDINNTFDFEKFEQEKRLTKQYADYTPWSSRYFPYKSSYIKIAPGIVQKVINYRDNQELTDSELYDLLLAEFSSIGWPFVLFSPSECANITMAEIKGDIDYLTQIYEVAEKRFKSSMFYPGNF